MRAFIIRPFGVQRDIDFEHVCETLIVPALAAVNVDGRTTLDILRAGNIRVDMFQRLLSADLVVADLTIHNANVFYELGIRHALREKRTFLLRADVDKYPFDLQTDRYLTYDLKSLDASRELLIAALKQSLASDKVDSPVFQLLPELEAQDRSRFLAVPRDFHEEVERAAAARACGDLELYVAEVRGLEWESEGLRIVGRAQFDLKASTSARRTWEAVLGFDADDLEANTWLATIYQRLGDLIRSDQALRRVLQHRRSSATQRSEARSLLARNAKTRWLADWCGLSGPERRAEALRSPYLSEALDQYDDAYNEDLNSYYPGVNALALLTVQIELATAQPDVWAEKFDHDGTASAELTHRRQQATELAGAVVRSITSERTRLRRNDEHNVWVGISEADRLLLTGQRPPRVAAAYRTALAMAPEFAVEAACSQLIVYERLDILGDAIRASLTAFPAAIVERTRASIPGALVRKQSTPRPRVVLFTGHRIDPQTGRTPPRFPADMEPSARAAIRKAVADEQALAGDAGVASGIAGGASGGDILFHETCADLGIPTSLYLALPPDLFCTKSVADSGNGWVERFYTLVRRLPPRVLAETEDLPFWLSDKPQYDIWQRNNLWMLNNALSAAGCDVTLIALWDGAEEGEGPGGTKDLVEQAEKRGVKTVILPTTQLFTATPAPAAKSV